MACVFLKTNIDGGTVGPCTALHVGGERVSIIEAALKPGQDLSEAHSEAKEAHSERSAACMNKWDARSCCSACARVQCCSWPSAALLIAAAMLQQQAELAAAEYEIFMQRYSA